jgi:hypothetical protein
MVGHIRLQPGQKNCFGPRSVDDGERVFSGGPQTVDQNADTLSMDTNTPCPVRSLVNRVPLASW